MECKRVYRILFNVIDDYNREGLGNGPEYISAVTLAWAAKRGIRIDFIQPGQPQQNAYVERYNRTVRYDWLAHHLFETARSDPGFCNALAVD